MAHVLVYYAHPGTAIFARECSDVARSAIG